MELMSPGSAAVTLPVSTPAHPEDEAGPDSGSPAPYEVGGQRLWGWGAGMARLSQLGEVHLTYQVPGKSLLRLRGRPKAEITPIPLRQCLWLSCPERLKILLLWLLYLNTHIAEGLKLLFQMFALCLINCIALQWLIKQKNHLTHLAELRQLLRCSS